MHGLWFYFLLRDNAHTLYFDGFFFLLTFNFALYFTVKVLIKKMTLCVMH